MVGITVSSIPSRHFVATEFRAAVATFMVIAYIIFANASILGTLADSRGRSLAFPAVLTVTCLSAGGLCILMGLIANVPFALAPGIGLNAVVTFQLVGQMKLTWPQAMTIIFVEGTLILLLVLTRFREAVMNAIPLSQKRDVHRFDSNPLLLLAATAFLVYFCLPFA